MQRLSNLITNHPVESGLTVAAIIVVFGLLVYGFGDLRKFVFKRVWAISSVVFRESIRRKILWLTPLAMFGIVVLTGLQRPEDESDSIRQTIKFCLFTSGLLVVITGVMLSCTNLPRDIDTKVIFTIVTKPVTRLEIVFGKVLGFARVTGAILVLMGLFTWSFLHLRAWQLGREISAKLSQSDYDEFARGRLEHQKSEGLLDTRTARAPADLQIVARQTPDSPLLWISTEQTFAVPFRTTAAALIPKGFHDEAKGETAPNPGEAGLRITLKLTAEQVGRVERAPQPVRAPLIAPADDGKGPYGQAEFRVHIINLEDEAEIIPSQMINSGNVIELPPAQYGKPFNIVVDPKVAPALAAVRQWGVVITPGNENYLLGLAPGDITVTVPGNGPANDQLIESAKRADTGKPMVAARGSSGRTGRTLNGPAENWHSVGLFHFKGPEPKPGDDGKVTLETNLGIERLNDDAGEAATTLEVQIINQSTGKQSDKFTVIPENSRITYTDVPAEIFAGGEFEVMMRVITPGHAVTVSAQSMVVIQQRSWFVTNLFKSLLSQWMLSVLVVTIGMFCSTFVSWPIAIVFSIVLLMGRWAVYQVSDSLQPGIGALLATDIGANDPRQAQVISATVDSLARMLNLLAQFLPDIDSFSTGEFIERGLAIPMSVLSSGGLVLLLFGLPVLTLSYIFLRNKEVAP